MAALIAIGWGNWRPGVRPPVPAPPGQATSVVIAKPAPGDTLPGDQVKVHFRLNGDLAPTAAVPSDHREGLGHLHVVLGDGRFDEPGHSDSQLFEVEGSSGRFSAVANDPPALTYTDVPPGDYTLRVELVPNDHAPGTTMSQHSVEFSVR